MIGIPNARWNLQMQSANATPALQGLSLFINSRPAAKNISQGGSSWPPNRSKAAGIDHASAIIMSHRRVPGQKAAKSTRAAALPAIQMDRATEYGKLPRILCP